MDDALSLTFEVVRLVISFFRNPEVYRILARFTVYKLVCVFKIIHICIHINKL